VFAYVVPAVNVRRFLIFSVSTTVHGASVAFRRGMQSIIRPRVPTIPSDGAHVQVRPPCLLFFKYVPKLDRWKHLKPRPTVRSSNTTLLAGPRNQVLWTSKPKALARSSSARLIEPMAIFHRRLPFKEVDFYVLPYNKSAKEKKEFQQIHNHRPLLFQSINKHLTSTTTPSAPSFDHFLILHPLNLSIVSVSVCIPIPHFSTPLDRSHARPPRDRPIELCRNVSSICITYCKTKIDMIIYITT
jgi:hypothetical protein